MATFSLFAVAGFSLVLPWAYRLGLIELEDRFLRGLSYGLDPIELKAGETEYLPRRVRETLSGTP